MQLDLCSSRKAPYFTLHQQSMYILRQALPLQMLPIHLSLVCGVNSTLSGFQMTVTH